MHIIMGGTGHVGSHVAKALIPADQAVTIITHNASRINDLRDAGAEIAEANVEDVDSLRKAFQCGQRAFLLNPPGDTSKDSDAIERRSVANILAALDGSGLEKVVAESTAGAQQGERIGDLSILWELEQGLAAQPIPAAINRAAYYMSNWDAQLDAVRKTGRLATMFPADLELPMAAPADLGRAAAERLMSPLDDVGVRYVEGPARYSSQDVVGAFAKALGREVHLDVTPPGDLKDAFLALGFSEPAADSYSRMTRVSIEQGFDIPEESWRGGITLEDYIRTLVGPSQMENQDG